MHAHRKDTLNVHLFAAQGADQQLVSSTLASVAAADRQIDLLRALSLAASPASVEPCALPSLLRAILGATTELSPTAPLAFDGTTALDGIHVVADEQRTAAAVRVLLRAALASGPLEHTRLWVTSNGHGARLHIESPRPCSRAGRPPDVAQLVSSTTRAGADLELALAATLIRGQGGELGVELLPDGGSEILIDLPGDQSDGRSPAS